MKRKVSLFLATMLALGLLSACDSGSKASSSFTPPTPSTEADTLAPDILPAYEYKIVKTGTEVVLPEVKFSETVTAVYTLDGTEVSAGHTFTPTEAGRSVLKIKATDAAGNTATESVVYNITDNDNDLDIVYAFDRADGLAAHAGVAGQGINHMSMKLRSLQEGEVTASGIPAIKDGETVVSRSFTECQFSSATNARLVLTNPLYTRWDEQFSQLYFYFYNAGKKGVEIRFNNYLTTVGVGGGWTKVVIAPKTVQGDNPATAETEESYIVTDYTLISSNGQSTALEGMIDLEDCVGSFFRFDTYLPYQHFAISSVYGVRK